MTNLPTGITIRITAGKSNQSTNNTSNVRSLGRLEAFLHFGTIGHNPFGGFRIFEGENNNNLPQEIIIGITHHYYHYQDLKGDLKEDLIHYLEETQKD